MKKKTGEPKPLAILKYSEDITDEIYVLDEGDWMAWNTSTNYDHHMQGPSIVIRKISQTGGHEKYEHYVNNPDTWHWIESLMRLGLRYMTEHSDHDSHKFIEEIKKEYESRNPYKSLHKNK